ncbi:MAG: FAD-dependent oxidoreductase [Clostridia bacterium]|nr:FAD-dependent oxidoreductase [Clostridia bacterium]
MYDIIVVGAGPAGLTAALYARRAEKSVLVIEKDTFGGQITHSPRVENYPGFIAMSGNEFADKLIEQVMAQGAEIELDKVTGISGEAGNYTVHCEGKDYEAKAVIIAAGSHHRKLGLPRENDFVGEGISYCAVCDGAFYKGKIVAVIGGGNSALQDAVLLSESCEFVYVVQNLDFLTGESSLAKILESRDNVGIVYSSVVKEIVADDKFSGIVIENTKTGIKTTLDCDGMFVAIGQVPENEPFKDVLSLNDYGYIVAGENCLPEGASAGIFVAGDCRTKAIRQVTTATADGAVAALAACRFIDSL